jgi:TP901 family phage tail tape measure protein
MSQGEFSVKVGGDFTEILNGFKALPGEAAKAGQGMEAGLNQPIQEARKSFGQLQTELRALKAQQAKLPLDSSEYKAAQVEINRVKQEIGDLARQKTKIPVDSSEVREASTQFRLLDGVVEGIAFSLANTFTNAAGTALQALSSIPQTISQFDTARAAVATLGVDTNALSSNFVGLSKELNNNVSQVELLQAAYDVASSGFADAAGNTEVMRAAALLATGGFTDLQTAGDGLTSVLNAYGLSAADATKVTDMIIQTQNDGKIVAGQYASQIGRLAPTAVASGVALEELNAAISSATAQGVPVESTFSGIQQAIVSILKPSQDASKFAAELGIQWDAASLQAKGFGGFLQQLVDKGAASSEAIIRLTGSTEAQTALMPLLNDGLVKYNENLERQKNSAGVAADASEKATATIDGSLKRLQNTFSNLTVQVFAGLAPIVAGAINAVTGFVQALTNLPTPVIALGGALLGLVSTVSAAAVAYGLFTSALVTNQIATARGAIVSLAASISGTLGAVVPVATVAVGKLTAALVAVSTTQISLGAIAAAIQTNIVAAANAGVAAFGKLATAITSGTLISGMATFGAGAKALLVALGPLALALGAVAAAVAVWDNVLSGAKQVTGEFANSQKAVSEALVVLGGDLDATAEKARKSQAGFLGLGEVLRSAREGWTLLALVDETEKLEQGYDEVFNSALQFFNELKNGEQVTDAQRERAAALIPELQKIAAAYRDQAESAKLAAVEAARIGNADEAKFRESQVIALESNARALDNLVAGYQKELGILPEKTAATQADTISQEAAKKAVEERAKAESELNQIISQAPVRDLDAQLAVGEQLIGLAKALAEQEQSRFNLIRSGLEFELANAESRGESERKLADIRKQIQEIDRQSAEARFRALTQQQELETQLLDLAQQKARVESNLEVNQARVDLLKAEGELRKATSAEERAAAQAQADLQREILGVREEGAALLGQVQPLEQQILKTQQETAITNEKAKLAQDGYRVALDGSVTASQALATESAKIREQAEERKKLEQQILEIGNQATLRQATEQLEAGQQLLELAQSLSALEQSRFDIVRSRLDFELQEAQKRGASEEQIEAIRERIRVADEAGAVARFDALLKQQQLEAQILEIAQRKQVLEANQEIRQRQLASLEAEKGLRDAILAGDQGAIAVAQAKLALAREGVAIADGNLASLLKLLPLEQQILANQQQTAINAQRAQAAQSGFQLAAAGSAVQLNNSAAAAARFSNTVAEGANNQQRLAGFMSITRADADVTADAAGLIRGSLDGSINPADGIAKAFVSTGKEAPAAAKGAGEFAVAMGKASGVTGETSAKAGDLSSNVGESTDLAGQLTNQMGNVAASTQAAANAARTFYQWLEFASRLPGSRWTGGPVEAGEAYKVNELGQEALLAGGRLSLINAPANSVWRAPTNGTVIPAGITARLQEQGVLGGGPGGSPIAAAGGSSAALAVEIGKLRQEVAELTRKEWNVSVTNRSGPTVSQVLKQSLR